jgi:Inner membrane protein YgaP-like, transmembrane domain
MPLDDDRPAGGPGANPRTLSQFGSLIRRYAVNVDRAVLTLAGSLVLISAALAWLVSPYWLLLTTFVGLNLIQAAFTGFCPAAIIFRKLGLKAGAAFECASAGS